MQKQKSFHAQEQLRGRSLKMRAHQRSFSYRLHPLHLRRIVWSLVVIVGLLVIQCAYNIRTTGQVHVLAYATTMSQQDLLATTNAQRQSAGLSPLTLSDQLSRAAQAKAQDMVARNYWAHVAPDGTAPWHFFDLAGYRYAAAGENLAYGFSTSSETVAAWMDSPAHRENLLGNYSEVGFGYVSAPNYQNGQNTVIVAFYGTPAAALFPAPVIGRPAMAHATSEQTKHKNGLPIIVSGHASWAIYASLGVVVAATVGFLITHLELLRMGWYKSRRYVALHPFFDAALLVGAFAVLVQAAGGFVK